MVPGRRGLPTLLPPLRHTPMNNSTEPDVPPAKVWRVSELNRVVRELLEQTFYPFCVRGQVSNLTIHRSGHVYFSLKDERSQVSVVFFRGAVAARQMQLSNGLAVDVWGRLTVYEPRGQYQLVVDRVRSRGVGILQQKFEQLKQKLRTEGLFDLERKRPIPPFPRCVGVVTSPDGAAVRDFLHVLQRRFADLHVRIAPAAVQGEQAAAQICAAIEVLNETEACDVIVLTRGGGSLEDLWPFNEEEVARAVAQSAIPVISAIGHEVDTTICDFVADFRAPTPSAAAELVIARKAEWHERIRTAARRLSTSLALALSELRRRVERAGGSYVFREPANLVRTYQQRIDELHTRLCHSLTRVLDSGANRLEQAHGRLAALDPHRVLKRGYSVLLTTPAGTVVSEADHAAPGQHLRAILCRGELDLLVEDVHAPAPNPGRGGKTDA